MNERIKELAKEHIVYERFTQCGESIDEVYYEFYPEELQEFAELIVRECIAQLEIGKKCDPYTGELFICERNDNIDYEIDVLKEHFGVE